MTDRWDGVMELSMRTQKWMRQEQPGFKEKMWGVKLVSVPRVGYRLYIEVTVRKM